MSKHKLSTMQQYQVVYHEDRDLVVDEEDPDLVVDGEDSDLVVDGEDPDLVVDEEDHDLVVDEEDPDLVVENGVADLVDTNQSVSKNLKIGVHYHGGQLLADIHNYQYSVIQAFIPTIINFKQLSETRHFLENTDIQFVIHAPFNINLAHNIATPKGQTSLKLFKENIAWLSNIIPHSKQGYLVVHVGKHLNSDKKLATETFIQNVQSCLDLTNNNVCILIETPAGQGTELFSDLESFISMYSRIIKPDNAHKIGLCVDTCHVFSAGYKLPEYLIKMDELLSRQVDYIGRYPIRLIHLNDSEKPLGSKVDRHANLGNGYLFPSSDDSNLETVLQFAKKYNIPLILETNPQYNDLEIDKIYQILGQHRARQPVTKVEIKHESTSIKTKIPDINTQIGQHLVKLANSSDDSFKKKAYLNASQIVSNLVEPIDASTNLKQYKGIGKSISQKITDFVANYNPNTTPIDENELLLEAVNNLTQVSGIGPATAKKLYNEHKISNISQLESAVKLQQIKLTNTQLASLKFHYDIIQRIPRSEIDNYDRLFKTVCKSVDPLLKHYIVGSYRRGTPDSGDIDILFYHPAIVTSVDVDHSNILKNIIATISQYLVVDSILSNGCHKVMLITHLNGKPSRRVDFMLTPIDSFATSLLYFTGSKELNVMMRNKAIELGYKLNEHGLYDKSKTCSKLDTPTEESVFKLLGMDYIEPVKR